MNKLTFGSGVEAASEGGCEPAGREHFDGLSPNFFKNKNPENLLKVFFSQHRVLSFSRERINLNLANVCDLSNILIYSH